ncbi:MAG: hypothetical protein ACTSR8_04300 [Promethearchaeota archaeon]
MVGHQVKNRHGKIKPRHDVKYEIFRLIAQGKTIKQINLKLSLSYMIVYRIAIWFELNKYIIAVSRKPLLYDLTDMGKIYISSFEKKSKILKNFEKLPIDTSKIHIRHHKILYVHYNLIKNPLIDWNLPPTKDYINVNDLWVKKVKLHSNEQFYISIKKSFFLIKYLIKGKFAYREKYPGLSTVKITTKKVLYFFKRSLTKEVAYTKKQLLNDEEEMERTCESFRFFLESIGFDIRGPLIKKSAEYGRIKTKEEQLKANVNPIEIIKEDSNGKKHIEDTSPGVIEEETNNREEGFSIFDLKGDVNNIGNRMDRIENILEKLTINISNLVQGFNGLQFPKTNPDFKNGENNLFI